MPGAIIEIAGIADSVGRVPAEADRAAPSLGGDLWAGDGKDHGQFVE